mmetsp:Transcript_93346/g.217050  ORF Transcript_93346/g.217050 Transcript_93346/m.217050 type:complete len:224 (-) Transcript_93346:1297-1968(-)
MAYNQSLVIAYPGIDAGIEVQAHMLRSHWSRGPDWDCDREWLVKESWGHQLNATTLQPHNRDIGVELDFAVVPQFCWCPVVGIAPHPPGHLEAHLRTVVLLKASCFLDCLQQLIKYASWNFDAPHRDFVELLGILPQHLPHSQFQLISVEARKIEELFGVDGQVFYCSNCNVHDVIVHLLCVLPSTAKPLIDNWVKGGRGTQHCHNNLFRHDVVTLPCFVQTL